jgi:L-fuculose-phosphate aldolase
MTLANHGLIACDPSLRKALWLANEVETIARQYATSRQLGDFVVLSNEGMAHVIEKFQIRYGPKDKA